MATNNAPTAPAISADLNLTVSIHHSHPLTPNNEHGSGRHLASVGHPLLEAAYIAALSGMYAFQGNELEVRVPFSIRVEGSMLIRLLFTRRTTRMRPWRNL